MTAAVLTRGDDLDGTRLRTDQHVVWCGQCRVDCGTHAEQAKAAAFALEHNQNLHPPKTMPDPPPSTWRFDADGNPIDVPPAIPQHTPRQRRPTP